MAKAKVMVPDRLVERLKNKLPGGVVYCGTMQPEGTNRRQPIKGNQSEGTNQRQPIKGDQSKGTNQRHAWHDLQLNLEA